MLLIDAIELDRVMASSNNVYNQSDNMYCMYAFLQEV